MTRALTLCGAGVLLIVAACGDPILVRTTDSLGEAGQDEAGGRGALPQLPAIDHGGTDGDSSCAAGACGGAAGERPTVLCGNGELDDAEACDDGGTVPGDGCDGVCRIEPGYVCDTPGQPCEYDLVCGDGVPGPDEACDDHNQQDGDGCSAECTVEPGFTCPEFGEPCIPTDQAPECGNSTVDAGETCDDGNVQDDDGCSAVCQTEPGWLCGDPGNPCELNEYCGDGILNGEEECDDGNTRAGDCCDGTCQLEPFCVCEDPDPPLDPPRQICSSTVVCGDLKVTGPEACDDGGQESGDGCSADCNNVEPGYSCPVEGGACTPATTTCGNATLDAGEQCDDGQNPMTSGDGCSADCKVEPGYVCPTPGSPCVVVEYCGDGAVSFPRGETCDDGVDEQTGEPADGDGCSAACKVETGWSCTGEPSECVYTVVCGDRKVGWGETCDDGNADSDDGCSQDCTVEIGWTCPVAGLACRPVCGDGILVGLEECEFTTGTPPTGCSETCRIEPGYDCVPDGSNPGNSVCTLTVCGNGVTERGEQCDDGANDLPFDGCYQCRLDPICSGGECESICGDGQRYADEECDDGNTRSGDGCSADCEIEYGFYCEDITATPPPTMTQPVVARDFVGKDRQLPLATGSYHEDFNRHGGDGILNMVKPQLGANGKPEWRWYPYIGTSIAGAARGCSCDEAATFVCRSESWDGRTVQFCAPPCSCTDGSTCLCDNSGHMYKEGNRANLSNPANFEQWYTNVADVNLSLPFELTLARDAGTGNYVYDPGTDTFDPIGLGGWIAAGRESQSGCTVRNVSFTTETHFWFEYAGGERFDFSGDDDTWVFVAGQLVIDLGGLHVAHSGSLVLDADTDGATSADTADGSATWWSPDMPGAPRQGAPARIELGLQPGGVYELVMFQAERNQCGSNFAITLKDFNRPRSECESYCGDGIVSSDEACDLGTENNTGEHGGCNPDCTLAPYCGDGQLDADAGEVCDDGVNTTLYDNSQSGCAPGCVPAHYCGDGEVDTGFGETCDNGAANSSNAYGPDACTALCQTAPFCGDGLRNGTEQCDDGTANGTPTSACDTSCQVKCGNGVVEAGEQCDDGAENNTGPYGGCRSDCTLAPYCGDGVRNGSEQCDDGRNDGSYGTCRSDCTLAPYCGDGTLDAAAGELCDDGADNVSNGYGEGLCTTRCRPGPYCGDSTVDAQFGELCDDGDDNSNSTPGACRVDCSGYNPPGATCGNGEIDAGEQCDDGEANGTTQSSCDVRCQLKCGNGIKDAGEECDNGINDGSYGTCEPDCTLGEYCGDGVKNGPEQCDLGEDNEPDPYGAGKCTEQCTLAPYCGDRRLQSPPEECDGQSGCTSLCTWPLLI